MYTLGISGYERKEGGAFSTVFIKNGRAFKLFKSYNHPDYDGTGKEEIGEVRTNDYRRKVFQTQVEAYKLVQKSELLKKFTPKFYGPTILTSVMENNKDISERYLLDCCYEMDYVVGKDDKLHEISQATDELKKIEVAFGFSLNELSLEFRKIGINYIHDSSVIHNDKEFKIIDFATINSNDFEPVINANW